MKSRLVIFSALVAGGAAALVLLPLRPWLAAFLSWVDGLGSVGPIVLAAAYVPAALLFVPGWILTLGAGFAFGVPIGVAAVSVGSVLGACAAFFTGRTLLRPWVERKMLVSPMFHALDAAVAREGFRVVLLTRLSPVFPYNLLNYAYGLTRVSFRDFVLASWIGMLPGTILYVYLGSAAKSLTDLVAGNVGGGAGSRVLFGVGLVATLVLALMIARMARRALRATLAVDDTAASPQPSISRTPPDPTTGPA